MFMDRRNRDGFKLNLSHTDFDGRKEKDSQIIMGKMLLNEQASGQIL